MKAQPVVRDSPFKPDDGVEQRGEEEDVDARERDSDDFRWLETQDFVENSLRPGVNFTNIFGTKAEQHSRK